MRNLGGVLFLILCSLPIRDVSAQAVNVVPLAKPGYALSISFPPVIRPKSEFLLETSFTNKSESGIPIETECPIWKDYEIDIQDVAGVRLPEIYPNQALTCMDFSHGFFFDLLPGKSFTHDLMLDQLYDLSKPGEYTVEISFYDYVLRDRVRSNAIRFRVPQNTSSLMKAKKAFSVSISSPTETMPIGWGIPIKIELKNLTKHDLSLPIWEGVAHHAFAPTDEVGVGFEVFDLDQGVVLKAKQRSSAQRAGHYPEGNFIMTVLKPGETIQQIRVLGSLYDITKPGRYYVQVVLMDPTTNILIKSNQAIVTVADPSHIDFAETQKKIPPFIVTIRNYSEMKDNKKNPLLMCMSNISDRDLRLDIVSLKDVHNVEDSQGNPVKLTEAGLNSQKLYGSTSNMTADKPQIPSLLKPGESVCTVDSVGALYDLSKPGDYRVRVDRYDEPDASPGEKLHELQVIQSNWISLTVPKHEG